MEPHLLRVVMDNVNSGVTIADATQPDLPLVFVNQGFVDITGYSIEESIGVSCRFLQGDDRDQPGLQILRKALNERKSCVVRLRNYRKDGSLFHNELHISPVYNENNEVTHFVGIQHNVTEQVRTREALERSEERLREALEKERELNEIKSAFISMISHEFRTPMTGIQTSTALLRRFGDTFPEDKRNRHYDNVEISLKRMNRLIDDVLFFSRSEANKVEVQREPLDLRAYLSEVTERMAPIYHTRQVDLKTELDGDAVYMIDSHMLDHILHNLIGNAFKYSASDTAVGIIARETGEFIEVTVSDCGIGIPEADQVGLFEPFHRAGNVEARQGTGLGLNIARRAARLLGGDISFKSTETVGSTFVVSLPKIVPAP